MAAFSTPYMFRSCVTLGFFNSVFHQDIVHSTRHKWPKISRCTRTSVNWTNGRQS
jgi:hypothetical protein